ncbi:hypothetical protein MetexDRAFT_4555, partial [Methylorubrum extorquens DSM 13060]
MAVLMAVIMAVVVPAASVGVAVPVTMVMMSMSVMAMSVMRMGFVAVMMMVVAALAVIVRSLFRLERAVHGLGRAAGAADQLGGAGRHIENLRADLRGDMLTAELPGEPQQAGRIAGADFQKRFFGGTHGHEAPVLELQRIAVLKARGTIQVEIDGQASRCGQVRMRLAPGGMIEGHRVDDEIGPNGGLADDQAGFGHGDPRIGARRQRAETGRFCNRRAFRWQAQGEKSCADATCPNLGRFMCRRWRPVTNQGQNGAPRRQMARSPMHKGVRTTMKRLIAAALAGSLALSLGACNTPQDRALGGAALGAGLGAAVGGLATG